MKLREMTYTKDNGDISKRKVVVVSSPRDNYLMYDVTKLTDTETLYLMSALIEADQFREQQIQEFEVVTGIKLNSLWRSFKPGGIDWDD